MEFYDANLFYGVPVMAGAQCLKPAKTIADLDAALLRAGAKGGLVRSLTADVTGAVIGNRLLADALHHAKTDLYGIYTILPSCTWELPNPEEQPEVMRASKMMAARFAPSVHNFLAKPGVLADQLAAFTRRKVPVMMDTGAGLTLEECWDYCEAFPDMTVILAYKNIWPADRYYRPFLEAFPNLHLELSSMITDQGLERLVAKYGAHRFLYGSRFPEMYMGGQMMMLRCAEISEEDKSLIAGGNFLRLASWMKGGA